MPARCVCGHDHHGFCPICPCEAWALAPRRPVMCDDGITPCPEPEYTGCTHVKRKLCRDAA